MKGGGTTDDQEEADQMQKQILAVEKKEELENSVTLKEGRVGESIEMQRRTLLCSGKSAFYLHGTKVGS